VAFLNWRFGLTQTMLWRIEVAPVPDLSNVATPTKAIITIPITLYGYGNGDDGEEGAPERRRDGREHGERKRDKARRCSRPARPLRASIARHTSLHEDLDLLLAEGILPLPILVDEVGGARRAAPPVFPSPGCPPGSPLAPSNPPRPERSRPHHSFYDPSGCVHTTFPKTVIVLQKDHRHEAVDARRFGGRSKAY
jgi:hypothetical protein